MKRGREAGRPRPSVSDLAAWKRENPRPQRRAPEAPMQLWVPRDTAETLIEAQRPAGAGGMDKGEGG